MEATDDGGGYWIVAADGGVFSYGDAPFGGSEGSTRLNAPMVGIAGFLIRAVRASPGRAPRPTSKKSA